MARRISWTNNSMSYDGTNIYRAVTIDPQNLPAPLATVGPVAQGATVEYIDLTGSGDQCYAVRDFDSGGDGALSDAACLQVSEPFDPGASIGNYTGGGVYAGTITYADAREFHIVFSVQDGEADPAAVDTRWQTDEGIIAGADDVDDGRQNTDDLIAAGISNHPAASHCINYDGGGHVDWYLGSPNEMALEANLRDHAELSTDTSNDRWTSRETSSSAAATRSFTGSSLTRTKTITSRRVRPVRRIPV